MENQPERRVSAPEQQDTGATPWGEHDPYVSLAAQAWPAWRRQSEVNIPEWLQYRWLEEFEYVDADRRLSLIECKLKEAIGALLDVRGVLQFPMVPRFNEVERAGMTAAELNYWDDRDALGAERLVAGLAAMGSFFAAVDELTKKLWGSC